MQLRIGSQIIASSEFMIYLWIQSFINEFVEQYQGYNTTMIYPSHLPRSTQISQVIGIALALIAIMIINFKREEDSVITLKAAFVGTFLFGGLADFTSKIYQVYGLEKFQPLFLLFTFVSAMGYHPK